jgi:hypothetical protein
VEPNLSLNTKKRVDVITGEIYFEGCRMVGNHGAALLACLSGLQGPFLDRISLHSCQLRCDQTGASRYGFIFDVPDGEVTNCTLHMGRRTAFLGWSRLSEARFRFSANDVHGRNPGSRRPLLHVRAGAGAPVIERNRFLVSSATLLDPLTRKSIIRIDNPNAVLRANQILVEP